MVRDYTTTLYEPAAATADLLLRDGHAVARELASWKQRVVTAWPGVKIASVDTETADARKGEQREIRASVELGGLSSDDVLVQAVHGPIDWTGTFVNHPEWVTLEHDGDSFVGRYTVADAGAYGVTVRCLPRHDGLVTPVELALVAWAS
jgi:starch phosphorylase